MLRQRRYSAIEFVASDALHYAILHQPPIPGETVNRATAAIKWLYRAQDATPDGGVSYGYFPGRGGWRPSYPETTGYIIPTLLAFSNEFKSDEARVRAIRMGEWETSVQLPDGAVRGGWLRDDQEPTPAVFNTGMVLYGWTVLAETTGNDLFLESARRAADFLKSDLREDGTFRTHGAFVSETRIKTYECLCGWALYQFGTLTGDSSYHQTALAAVRGALDQQLPNGWFANNCLERPLAPLLHTIGYTLQGILEVGVLSGRADLIDAARRGVDPILLHIHPSGFVPGRFDSAWSPASRSECLTGSAQLAIVCYRLTQELGDLRYRESADRIVNHLKTLQSLTSNDPGINGAIAGSFPFFGDYITAGFPNWATKYYLDALMLQNR
jgi:hypothetical protein